MTSFLVPEKLRLGMARGIPRPSILEQCVSWNEYNRFVPHLNIEILFYFLLVM